MAQLVEQRIRNAWVRGSSPRVGSSTNKSQILAMSVCVFLISFAMTKKTRNILLSVSALVVLLVGFAAWAVRVVVRPAFELDETAYVYVRPSTTEADVLRQLQDEAHARSLVGWHLLRSVADFHPRTGRYAVHPDDNILTVLRRLRNGRQTPVRLTLPSVRRLSRLAGTLAGRLMLDSAEVADAFADERYAAQYGYTVATLPALFIPNTYEIFWNTTLEAFMQRMQRQNASFWAAEGRDAAAKALGMSHEEVATLASIVDEETADNAEKPRVAGVYLNRLQRHIPLQADPTVKFATGDDSLRRILAQHLRTLSPYNTYLNLGLPPGPIRIPSIAAIDAVLKAEKHDYIYFCAKEDFSGTHNFATNYPEHMANARRYQRALNARGIR